MARTLRTERYGAREYASVPSLYARCMEGTEDEFVIAVDGQEVPAEASDSYFSLMRRFSLGFAFFPYCEAFGDANFSFGRPNPILEVTLEDGSVVDCARQLNPGVMFFSRDFLFGVEMDCSVGSAFLEKFVDDLASVGGLPSNGVFIDVHGSYCMMPKYRRARVLMGRSHQQQVSALGITLDSGVANVVEWLRTRSAVDDARKVR